MIKASLAVLGSMILCATAASQGHGNSHAPTTPPPIQLMQQIFCLPGQSGVIICPCNNPPVPPGMGCGNSFGTSASLTGSGSASLSADTFTLAATGELPSALTVFWQGQNQLPNGVIMAAGIRCVSTGLRRLYIGNAAGGAIVRPGPGDLSLSARSAALGDPLTPGSVRFYFNTYRDPGATAMCAFLATFNTTNAGVISWAP
jgi:hypothetical protein